MDKIRIITQAHQVLETGESESCHDNWSNGHATCQQCCTHGAVLIDGEADYLKQQRSEAEWKALGVNITANRITGCMSYNADGNKQGCKMGADKALHCKIYPHAIWKQDPRGVKADLVDLKRTDPVCPASKQTANPELMARIAKAQEILEPLTVGDSNIILSGCPAEKMALTLSRMVRERVITTVEAQEHQTSSNTQN